MATSKEQDEKDKVKGGLGGGGEFEGDREDSGGGGKHELDLEEGELEDEKAVALKPW